MAELDLVIGFCDDTPGSDIDEHLKRLDRMGHATGQIILAATTDFATAFGELSRP